MRQLFALAYNLANFLRQLALSWSVRTWTLTTLREKLIKIGAKVVRHAKAVTIQLAEVAVPRALGRRCARTGIRLADRSKSRRFSLDPEMRPVSNAYLGEPGAVPDAEVDTHLRNPG